MITELKTFEITCDCCGTSVETRASRESRVKYPEGWEIISVGPCGLTDYYRNELRCPKCVKK